MRQLIIALFIGALAVSGLAACNPVTSSSPYNAGTSVRPN